MSFLPALRTVFSPIMTAQIEEQLVLGQACNYTYESDAQLAKNVIINTLGAVTIGDYNAATGLSGSLQSLSFASQSLTLDKQKFFNMYADATLLSATNLDVIAAATRKAAYGLAEAADAYIGSLYNGFVTSASVSTGVTVNATGAGVSGSAYDYIVDLAVKLNEQNAPLNDRFVAVPFWYLGMLAKDSRFTTSQPVVLSNGIVQNAKIAGLQVLATNNLNTTGTTKIMAFQKDAIAFAAGLNNIEAYSPENYFGKAIKGLYIFGAKVIVPEYGCLLYAVKG